MVGPLRVAQVMGYMNGGGVEQVVMNYYRHIDRSRVQFDLIVCEGSTLVPREEVESFGGRVFMVPPYSNVIGFQRTLETLFHDQGWGIVHSHMNALSVLPLRAAKFAGTPVRIAHSHSTAGKGECAKNALKAILRTQANRYPTHRFACSEYAGQWLFGKSADFEVIRNAIELDRFAFNPTVREEVRYGLGIGEGCLAILHVGRFMPQKNHPFLIEVFAHLIEKRPDSVLLLVGTGEDEAAVREQTYSLGISDKVRFLGQRDDVERMYMAADAFALPSLYEGLGIVGIEAQMAGLPCFLSSAITREVDVTEACTFLPIADPLVWASQLQHIFQGKRIKAHKSCFADYDINSASMRMVNRYESML